MQFPDLQLPPQPATDKWLQETNSRDDVEVIIPMAVEEEGVPWVFGAMIFSDEAVTMVYNDFLSWNLFTEYELKHDFRVYIDDLMQPEVGVIREDSRILRRLANEFAEKILDETGLAFAPYADPHVGEGVKAAQENCDCCSISEPQVRPAPGLSGLDSERIFLCANCGKIHGLEYDRRPILRKKAFDADWVLDGGTADRFYDVEVESDFLLYSTGEDIGKLEHAVALMNSIGGSISSSFSAYVPEKHKSLVYVKDESEITGYLTWTTGPDGTLSLQQLFTREEYRGQGVASTLVSVWEQNFCDEGLFYVEEPNDKSRTLLRTMEYFDGEPEAVEHYLFRGLVTEWEEGKERADSVSGFQEMV